MNLWFALCQKSLFFSQTASRLWGSSHRHHKEAFLCVLSLNEKCLRSLIYYTCVSVYCVRCFSQAKWGNRTASWPLKWWRTWWRTQSLTNTSWSSGTRVSWRTVPPAGSTWTSSSSSMSRWDSTDSLSVDRIVHVVYVSTLIYIYARHTNKLNSDHSSIKQ